MYLSQTYGVFILGNYVSYRGSLFLDRNRAVPAYRILAAVKDDPIAAKGAEALAAMAFKEELLKK